MAKLAVGIIFGGVGEEHPISVKSARQVKASIDTAKYEPFWIGITIDGQWKLCDGPDGDWEHEGRSVALSPDHGAHGLIAMEGERTAIIHLDVLFPVVHGKTGEDGALQGLMELSGIPYVGCGIASSAICMDKSLAYTIVRGAGIETPDFRIIAGEDSVDPDTLHYPVFVKPARSGSSFGVSKVSGAGELPQALETARQYDSKVLIEEAIIGREIGCSILGAGTGNADGAELFAGELDHVAVTHGFFRIHQEDSPETGSENSTFIVPADISSEARALIQETAKRVYRALGCEGLARVDMFLTDDGRAVLNEVNTLPGLTSYSRYPRMMAAAGLTMPALIDRLMELALTARR